MSKVGSRYQRANFRINADYDAYNWLTIGVTTSLVKSWNLAASSGLNTHITRPPLGMAYDDEGNILQYINSSGDKNPLYDAQYEKEQTDANIIRLNGYIDIHPFKGFSYRLNAGYYNRFSENGAQRTEPTRRRSSPVEEQQEAWSTKQVTSIRWRIFSIMTFRSVIRITALS